MLLNRAGKNGGGAIITGQRAILEKVFEKTMQYMDKQIGVFSSPL